MEALLSRCIGFVEIIEPSGIGYHTPSQFLMMDVQVKFTSPDLNSWGYDDVMMTVQYSSLAHSLSDSFYNSSSLSLSLTFHSFPHLILSLT